VEDIAEMAIYHLLYNHVINVQMEN